jgi:hypothetical protein
MASPSNPSARASATYRSKLFCGLSEVFERRLCRSDAGGLEWLLDDAVSFVRSGLGFRRLTFPKRLV